ncbi:putative peptide zinc metalloprotease protein YydH [Ruminiclostridium hungatei]|uniref:Putative peptide zinc metalloprotease protein YydH n=1 Tax=Ruminiclostridium hungatei TaxID=48256 RepID=A0A1V4SMT1_RUMHU|nr:M50 family metallopeptidase [Ruminiclostridium hungatei]OPX45198.1 putative peptide zinc metalloprotease protein YydH [Ruminiclostridium hungatei]
MSSYGNIEIDDLGNNMYLVKNIHTSKYVKLGTRETKYLTHLIGDKGNLDIEAAETGLNEEERNYLNGKFLEWGFLSDGNDQDSKAGSPGKRFKNFVKNNDLTNITVASLNPDMFLDKCMPVIKALLSPVAMIIYFLLFLLGWKALSMNYYLMNDVAFKGISIRNAIIIYIMQVITIGFHELGHAITCKYYGGKVRKMGIKLFFLLPAMYCDISEIYTFKSRKKKMLVSFAGVLVNFVAANIALIIYALLNYFHGINSAVLAIYYFVNIGLGIFNLIPFVKLDGYWILSGFANITNFMDKSINLLLKLIVSPKEFAALEINNTRKFVMVLYGLCVCAVKPAFWAYSLYIINRYLSMVLGQKTIYLIIFIAVYILFTIFKDAIKRFKDVISGTANTMP